MFCISRILGLIGKRLELLPRDLPTRGGNPFSGRTVPCQRPDGAGLWAGNLYERGVVPVEVGGDEEPGTGRRIKPFGGFVTRGCIRAAHL